MGRVFAALIGTLVALVSLVMPVTAQQAGPRLALVIGEGSYAQGALPTAANDAGLVAQTLTAAGFDVTGARDLDGDGVRHAFRDFLAKAGAAGPDAIVFVYLSGYALQFDGDNVYVPVDAVLAHEGDIPIQAIRVADITHALAGLPLKARVFVLDGAYADPALPASSHVAPGLALVDPDAGSLIAFNAAPGIAAPVPAGAYGVYAQSLAATMREGGVGVEDVFDRVRLRVNQLSRGAVVPWDVAKLSTSFVFFDRAPDAPAASSAQQSFTAMSKRPIREFPVEDAYSVAVARDTFSAYDEFLAAYPDSSEARRVRALLAIRREALTWRRTVGRNAPAAYWTYLSRYPRGPHVYDCRRRLAILAAALEPPPTFSPIVYDVPPPPPPEIEIVDAPTVYFDDADYPPPPPPPLIFLPPPPVAFVDLPPPPPPIGPGFLPIPMVVPIPYAVSVVQPGRLSPPPFVGGSYAQPQPFAAGPNGGIVAQPAAAPAQAGPASAQPLPTQPGTASGAAVPLKGMSPAAMPGGVAAPAGSSAPAQPVGAAIPPAAAHVLPRPATPLASPQTIPAQPALRPTVPAGPAGGSPTAPGPAPVRPVQPLLPQPAVKRIARPAPSSPAAPIVPAAPITPAHPPAASRPVPKAVVTPLSEPQRSPTPVVPLRPTAPPPAVRPTHAPVPQVRSTTLPNAARQQVQPVRPSPKTLPAENRTVPRPAPQPKPPQEQQNRAQQQQIDAQRRQQQDQQRAQQNRARQQQDQQRQQQDRARQQQQQQQRAQHPPQEPKPRACGHPGAPPCR